MNSEKYGTLLLLCQVALWKKSLKIVNYQICSFTFWTQKLIKLMTFLTYWKESILSLPDSSIIFYIKSSICKQLMTKMDYGEKS